MTQFAKIPLLLLALLCASCMHNRAQPQAAADPTGCCQVAKTSCASPVTEARCEALGGNAFHEGGSCRTDSGQCGVLQQ